MQSIPEHTMPAFDYHRPAELFRSKGDAGVSPTNGRKLRHPTGYGRFAHAAYAIRFAVEELPSEHLPDACLDVNAELFVGEDIRRLYDSDDYPLARRATPVERISQLVERVSQSDIRFRAQERS
jgi:hypothetical protein